ncbi:cytochrome o ubiquinol oxidase subunit IV [Roseibium sp. RKSG952]|uniref:cytochrome o ubiquinol oxidase subunit IV n=1 Tax=Roseibium sp. RKSG952 TaxID=2529384 RepID=UPI0012BD3FBE|nr:cytochrome o ubiquinol oxidase subunit IV [Roseibium sp. RKSG952]MTH95868.1 cytochrome o ubiquinol oxidase subunit IV [Roseibium sp. RKSG952]
MSAETHSLGHVGAHEAGASHSSLSGYAKAFILSVVLTVLPFWLVMANVIEDKLTTSLLVVASAVVQIVVHVVYFLHLDRKSEGGWNLLSFLFTVIILAIAIAGSLWVMHHLNVNMMPVHDMGRAG